MLATHVVLFICYLLRVPDICHWCSVMRAPWFVFRDVRSRSVFSSGTLWVPCLQLFVFRFSLLANRVEVFLPLHLSTTYSFYMCCTHTIVNLGSVSGERNGIFPLTGCLRFSFGIVLILPTMLVSNTCLVVGLSHYVCASGSSFLLLLKFAGW